MSEPDHARRAPKSYFALVRTHAVDLAATAFYLSASVSQPAASGDTHSMTRFSRSYESSRLLYARKSLHFPQPTTFIRLSPI
jgi:hypothetical protein